MSRQQRYIPDFVLDNLDNVKSEALKQGYTMKDLGAVSGMAPAFISGLRLGQFTPTQNNYNKLAQVLGWEQWQ